MYGAQIHIYIYIYIYMHIIYIYTYTITPLLAAIGTVQSVVPKQLPESGPEIGSTALHPRESPSGRAMLEGVPQKNLIGQGSIGFRV